MFGTKCNIHKDISTNNMIISTQTFSPSKKKLLEKNVKISYLNQL